MQDSSLFRARFFFKFHVDSRMGPFCICPRFICDGQNVKYAWIVVQHAPLGWWFVFIFVIVHELFFKIRGHSKNLATWLRARNLWRQKRKQVASGTQSALSLSSGDYLFFSIVDTVILVTVLLQFLMQSRTIPPLHCRWSHGCYKVNVRMPKTKILAAKCLVLDVLFFSVH